MSKSKKDYRTYIIAASGPTEQLDAINRLGGVIYSKTVSLKHYNGQRNSVDAFLRNQSMSSVSSVPTHTISSGM